MSRTRVMVIKAAPERGASGITMGEDVVVAAIDAGTEDEIRQARRALTREWGLDRAGNRVVGRSAHGPAARYYLREVKS